LESASVTGRALRIGIVTDGLQERIVDGEVRIANGGVGVYICELIRHLLELDSVNQYFLIRFGEGRLDIYRHPRAQAVFLPRGRVKNALQAASDLPYRRLARELRLDLIHYTNQFGGAFLPRSVKRVATLHDLTPILFPQTHPRRRVVAYRLMARVSLRRCDRVIVHSMSTRQDLVQRGFAQSDKIVAIPSGVSPLFRPGVESAGFAERYRLACPFMLTVGVLEPRKNQILLFEVLRQLRHAGHEIDLVIIGREGWRWSNPLEGPGYSDLRPWVRILQDVSDNELVEFYGRAAVFAYPSIYEGFGLPVLEAMACGAPVASSDASSLPEVGGAAVLYADPHDAAGFAVQVMRLLSEADLRRQMVAAGLERARQFSWRRTAESTLRVYQTICGGEQGVRQVQGLLDSEVEPEGVSTSG
jgi:glycosyltransferase involved in cell wall biosynthesis